MTEQTTETTALEARRPVSVLPPAAERGGMWNLAQQIANTDFVPKALRGNPPAIMAAMLTGREMGIGPMRALRQVQMIEGRPTPAPELMMALALQAGHTVDVAETSNERCRVRVRRAEWAHDDVRELEWTLDDAVRAGLCELDERGRPTARSRDGKPLPWEQYPRAMLRSRAVAEACRAWLPDVVEGASYTPEELGAEVDANGHGTEVAAAAEAQTGAGYDPLEGEPAEVRQRVTAAMGDVPDGVDPATGEVIDGETVHDGDDQPAAPADAQPADTLQGLHDTAAPALARLHELTRGRQPYGRVFRQLRDDLQGDPRSEDAWLGAEAAPLDVLQADVADLIETLEGVEQRAGQE